MKMSLILAYPLEGADCLQDCDREAGFSAFFVHATTLSYTCHIFLQTRKNFLWISKLNLSLQKDFLIQR